MLNDVGNFHLLLAFALTLFALIVGAIGAAKRAERLQVSARAALLLAGIAAAISCAILGILFVTNDYSNNYVWQFSNRDMYTIYKITAIWGGMDGSMLLWAAIVSLMATIVCSNVGSYPRALIPWLTPSLAAITIFFLIVTAFLTNPFRYIPSPMIPPDGNGLNPLLQNPYMAAHPPMLYLGFTSFAVPFAFGASALLSGDLTNDWIRAVRRWTLVAWMFLTIGIILGGHWAYIELGWGGFWAWDPVENASFLPWLTGTAFLHSVMIQERKQMLKMWNIWLVAITYGLTVFGTFLTRSGVVQSVHAFASTDVGWVFLLYLGLIILFMAIMTFYRRNELRSDKKIESFFSREAFFLVNNLILLSICFATAWGVMFPVFSEAFTGQKQTVGIPFFNAVNIPLFLLLILAMGVGTLIAWRRASIESLRRTFLVPMLFAFFLAILLVWAGVTEFYPVLSYAICGFVIATIFGEFHRGIRAQKMTSGHSSASAVTSLFRRHRSRYAGYVVHLGAIVMTISITASMAHKIEREFSLQRGETYNIGRFTVTLDEVAERRTRNYDAIVAHATVRVTESGREAALLKPELRFYRRKQETTTEVALRMGPREDLYLVLAGLSEDGATASFKMFINPLQVWLWVGGLIIVAGTLVILLPDPRRATRSMPAKTSSNEVAV